MKKIIRWDTPFTEISYPSVGVYIEHGKNESDLLTVIVAPEGIDEYPKYLVHFGDVIEFNCYEEGFSPDRAYEKIEKDTKSLSAYKWVNSPNIQAYKEGSSFLASKENADMNHYIVFGGDNIVEVVTFNEYSIEKVGTSKLIPITLKI